MFIRRETVIYVKCLSCENVRTSSLPSPFRVLGGRDAIPRPHEETMTRAGLPPLVLSVSSHHLITLLHHYNPLTASSVTHLSAAET